MSDGGYPAGLVWLFFPVFISRKSTPTAFRTYWTPSAGLCLLCVLVVSYIYNMCCVYSHPYYFLFPLLFPRDPFFSTSPPVVTMFKMPLGPAATMTHEQLLRKGWSIMGTSSVHAGWNAERSIHLGPIPFHFCQSYFLSLAHLFQSHPLHGEIISFCVFWGHVFGGGGSAQTQIPSALQCLLPPLFSLFSFQRTKSLILPDMLFISSLSCPP